MAIAMRRLYRRLSSLKQDKSDKFDHMENIAKFIVLVDVTSAISGESNLPSADCKELNIDEYVLSDANSTDLKFITAG